MKLATYRDGSRDGQLVVVSRDLSLAHFAAGVASRLAQVLDDWGFRSPPLEDLYATLNGGKARHAFPFDPARCLAPLPRPVGVTRWRGDAAVPAEPGADRLAGARDAAVADSDDDAVAEPGIALITGDVPAGASPGAALDAVRLITLAVDLRGGSAMPALRATALGPVAVTPDELGDDWQRGRLARPLVWTITTPGQHDRALTPAVDSDLGAALARCARDRPIPGGHLLVALAGLGEAVREDAGEASSARAAQRLQLEWTGGTGTSPFGRMDLWRGAPAG